MTISNFKATADEIDKAKKLTGSDNFPRVNLENIKLINKELYD